MNVDEEKKPRARVPLQACFDAYCGEALRPEWRGADGRATGARVANKFAAFPPYLLVS